MRPLRRRGRRGSPHNRQRPWRGGCADALAIDGLASSVKGFPALPMCIGLGKYGFQLIARRVAGNLQLAGGDIGWRAARNDAGEFGFRRGRRNVLARIVAGGPGLGPRAFNVRRARTSCAGGCAGP